jgi:ADP-dependent NAD(P)H-hydrate dehydratase / NAD(P)H-hydrate epimerase
MILHDSQSSKQCDIDLQNEMGVDTLQLMELAAKVTADLIQNDFNTTKKPAIAIFCGPGNNGGDGLATARLLFSSEWKIFCYILKDSTLYTGATKQNYLSLKKLSELFPTCIIIKEQPSIDDIAHDFSSNHIDLILDAIFGVGLTSLISGYYHDVINLINALPLTTYSIDLPSGVPADSSSIMSVAIRAHKTITFSAPKIAHCLFPGKEYSGELIVKSIGVPSHLIKKYQKAQSFFNTSEATYLLPPRAKDSHKGTYGSVYVIGGSPSYRGAISMAVSSAFATGAGKVFAIYPSGYDALYSSLPLECIHMPLDIQQIHSSDSAFDALCNKVSNTSSSVLCIGPGLGRTDLSIDFVKQIYLKWHGNILIDADGLYAIKDLVHQFSHPAQLILTPHLGEMSYLTGLSIDKLKSNLLSTAQYYADLWNCTLVLKSATTIVASKNKAPFIQYFGNPGMATAGSGDVLAGIISALLSQQVDLHQAAILGTTLHSLAGDLSAKKNTMWSMVASDIINSLPSAFTLIS